MQNNYFTKRPQRFLKRSITDKDVMLTSFVEKKMRTNPTETITSPLNVSVNGKKISEHISPIRSCNLHLESMEMKIQNHKKKKQSKDINIEKFIHKKYLADNCFNQSALDYEINPSLDRLIKLRKMFNQKFRKKNFSEQKYAHCDQLLDNQISKMIRVTNPDIISSTYSKRLNLEKQKQSRNQRSKYPYYRKNKDVKLRMMYKWREAKGSWKSPQKGGNTDIYEDNQEGPTKLTPWEVLQ